MKFNRARLLFLVGSIPLVAAYYPLKDTLAPSAWSFAASHICFAYDYYRSGRQTS